jgi:ATP-dependent Clp protease ATP-binding subunit ClpC
MNVLSRFSTHLRDVLAKSIQLATELKHKQVEPIHLFFSLSGQKGSVAAEIIHRFKMDQKSLEYYLFNLPAIKDRPLKSRQSSTLVLTPLSPEAQQSVEKALVIAEQNRHNYVGTEHLLAGLIALNNPTLTEIFKMNAIALADLNKHIETVLTNATQFPHINEVADVVDQIQENLGDAGHSHQPGTSRSHAMLKNTKKTEAALDFFATELTGAETESGLDPVIGRAGEIERLIQILCRRSKNNPVLLGEPGVGKTAIVEGLAKRIVAGDVPDLLLNKKIYALDLGLLIAGTIYRGEFEGRLRQVIEEVTENPDIILFIDEIHNIVGAGSNQGTMDAGNILKPALSRGQIHCIGATTPQEFKKHIENDPALERRFQPIFVEEPSLADTVTILEGIKENYEHFHHIAITSEAIAMAVKLSDRYISNKFLPDKAIDLIDEAAAAKRLSLKAEPWQNKLAKLKRDLEKAIQAKEEAARSDHFEEAVQLKEQEEKIRTAIKVAEKAAATKKMRLLGTITERDILNQIARITRTAPTELILEDSHSLTLLEEKMRAAIVGQEAAVTTVAAQVRQALLGLSHPDRPLASFLFVGESGVGKTELAKTLAKTIYPGRDALIRLNMSEFNESFGVSKLLGSPAGYVGYKESNQFTDRINIWV